MTTNATTDTIRPRLWPALSVLVLLYAAMIGTSRLAPETAVHFLGMMFSPMVAAALFALWWLFASRVPWRDRLVGIVIVLAVGAGTKYLAHDSAQVALMVYGLTSLVTVLSAALLLTVGVRWSRRRWFLAAAAFVVGLFWTTQRVDGLDGNFVPDLAFRWNPTPEEEFLATLDEESPTRVESLDVSVGPAVQPGDWPGFRGPRRDGKVRGLSFATDWDASPPREVWRRAVGPGWSSFAVVGDLVFTQEQHGEDELVSCYLLEDGDLVWTNRVKTRFEETIGGPGPRATPTFDGGRLYALGATGTVQCLDPTTGETIWKRELSDDVAAKEPVWGFSSSPLVHGQLVIVFAGSGEGRSVVAYDRGTGEVVWTGAQGTLSYSSCHAARFNGVEQILMMSEIGLQALAPADGSLLWEHRWDIGEMARIVQPCVLGDSSVLVGTGYGLGTRRLLVSKADEGWSVEEGWTSRALKPYFNDFVEHEGHCYGFDAGIFTSINTADGKRNWKGGRYGHGQVVLVVDMDVLLVLSETGEVVLLNADPGKHAEIGRFQALEAKTWNHPVLAHGKLLVRNGEEAACYELTPP